MIRQIKNILRPLLRPTLPPPPNNGVAYFSAQQTLKEAHEAGLSLRDYIENKWGVPGAVEATIEKMDECGVFDNNPRIIELGPGTGNYLRAVKNRIKPANYEIYETAQDWREWLVETEKVVGHLADASSLAQSADKSADLIHAHGVFQAIPALASYSYFNEIFRVCDVGKYVVFDFCPIEEFEPQVWLQSPHRYPVFLSEKQVIAYFEAHGFALKTKFKKRWLPIDTTYFVFQKAS